MVFIEFLIENICFFPSLFHSFASFVTVSTSCKQKNRQQNESRTFVRAFGNFNALDSNVFSFITTVRKSSYYKIIIQSPAYMSKY